MSSDLRPVIVHVINALDCGGTERALVTLLHRCRRSRIRHIVVALRQAGRLASQLPPHVGCHSLGLRGRSRFGVLSLAGVIGDYGADIVHARNLGCWVDTVAAGVLNPATQIVLGFHGLERAGPFDRRQRRRAGWAYRLGARFTCVCHSGRRMLSEQIGISADRIDVLRNGVDTAAFAPCDADTRLCIRRMLGVADEDFLVGTVGALTPVKDHTTLVSAFTRLVRSNPHSRLVIIGDGPMRDTINNRLTSDSLTDRVIMTGRRDDVATLLGALDAYVCSSRSEGMSNALLEAMACGLPVVATDVGDNGSIIRDGVDGWLVAAGSVAGIAQKLASLAKYRSSRETLGAAARQRTMDFDLPMAVAAYERFYEQLLCLETRFADTTPGNAGGNGNDADRVPQRAVVDWHATRPRDLFVS